MSNALMPEVTEEFAYIVERFGAPSGVPPSGEAMLAPYRGRLPQSLLDFWARHGQGLMLDGKFQFCDPQRFAPISQLIFGNDPDLPAARCHIFGYSAFGTLLAWSEDHGYSVEGGAIALAGEDGETSVRVGTCNPADASMTATIAADLTGSSTLVKTDYGTLILTGTNSYAGGTRVDAGRLIGDAGAIIRDAILLVTFQQSGRDRERK